MGGATQMESKSRTGRHVTSPRQCFCLPLPQAQAFIADHIKVPVEPPGGCTTTGIEGSKDGGARGPPSNLESRHGVSIHAYLDPV
jgi:hypothetical protein